MKIVRILTAFVALLAALGFAEYAQALQLIVDKVPDFVVALSLVVSSMAALAAVTPSTKDDKLVGTVKAWLVNTLGFNFGKAENKEDSE